MSACRFGDPFCPCQDGDACHYIDYPGSPAMKASLIARLRARAQGGVEQVVRHPNFDIPVSISQPGDPLCGEAAAALSVPSVWSAEERDGMAAAFAAAARRHGHYESLFAAAAWLLRHRSGEATP